MPEQVTSVAFYHNGLGLVHAELHMECDDVDNSEASKLIRLRHLNLISTPVWSLNRGLGRRETADWEVRLSPEESTNLHNFLMGMWHKRNDGR